MDDVDKIKIGDYVVIQRQKYTKLHKFSSLESTAMLGKESIELRNIAGQPYTSTFKMVPKERGKRVNTLQLCTELGKLPTDIRTDIAECGVDNRNLIDNGQSQNLNATEIEKLREDFTSSSDIVGQIVENSQTFALKTEYSQEKYLKKKEKKYFEYVQIRRPNIRLITDIMYRQCAEKINGLRLDSVSQIVSYSGVCGTGNYLLYESGTNGLLPAVLINSIGANTDAQLVHMHPGNSPQRQALFALNLPAEQYDRCISVNIYSVLRDHFQCNNSVNVKSSSGTKRKIDGEEEGDEDCQPTKKVLKNDETAIVEDIKLDIEHCGREPLPSVETTPPAKQNLQQWKLDNQRASLLLKEQVDGLVICAKEHPKNIIKALLPFVKPSRPIVIFSLMREVLMELYVELKATNQVTNLRITSNWLRLYQVLPNRTHPDVNMSGNSGFLLCGHTIS